MTSSDQEKQTEPHLPRDDLTRLRSASPAIKRPASDMGAQDREEHTNDVEMSNAPGPSFVITSEPQTSDLKAKQQDTGKTHHDRNTMTQAPHASHPGAVQQDAPSESNGSSLSDSLLPTPSSNSTTATSIVTPEIPPTCTDLPSFDDQDTKIRELAERKKSEGQKGFVVSTKWWNRVQARRSHTDAKVDKDAAEGEIGPIDNSNLAMVTEDSSKLFDLADDKFVVLKPGLRYDEDYIIVPQDGWDLLVSWYGSAKDSPVITRYAYDTNGEDALSPNVDWELEPPIFTFLKVPAEHTPQTQKQTSLPPPKMVASKYMLANEWLKRAKQLVHIDLKTKVRPWRILGGLKSHAASGLPSPAASRSSSPAPGTEMVATVPDKMLLDVNTFVALPSGEHRDEMTMEDNTANEKYNGKSKLSMFTGRSDLVALEEQKKGGDWPSETSRLSLPKNLKDKAKGLTPSGRTSPAPGVTTRGRTRREGRPKGNIGLTNLGNTCYMNSALQSIRSVQELTEYFLSDMWAKELNKKNPLGHNGNVAKAYANLVKNIFEERAGGAFTPRDFKHTIGKYNPSFAGYGQQDSQEFLLFLLDGLSEDLNRIHNKPYIEKPDSTDEMVHDHAALKAFADRNWADYKARNDSIITDLFAGMYKSTLTCPVCEKVSIIFDPFSNLTLQLPIESTWSKLCVFLPLHGRPMNIEVEVDKHATMQGMKEFVSKRTGVAAERLIIAEGYKCKFYKIFDNPMVISEANIHVQNDVIFIMEVEDVPTNYNPNKKQVYSMFGSSTQSDEIVDPESAGADKLLVPVFHRYIKNANDPKRLSQRPFFGYASFVVLDREDNKTYDGVLRKVLGNVAGMTTRNIFEEVGEDDSSDAVEVNDDSSRSGTNTNEDGFVDVSMRDASVAPESTDSESAALDRFLKSDKPIPEALKSLFDICVKSTGEGIPTGWNQVSEHDDFTSIRSRIPKKPKSRPARSSTTSDEDAESEASEDLGDIPHDASTPGSDEGASEASENTPMASLEDNDDDTAAMFGGFKAQNRNKHDNRKVYRRKGKIIQGQRTQQREPVRVRQQPTPPDTDIDMLVRPGECIVLDWNLAAHDALFGGEPTAQDEDEPRGIPTWRFDIPTIEDPELQNKRKVRAARKKNGVSLEDCLNEFGKPETLSEQNMWYCPRCKEHRRAEKKFELWKAPDILIMHLKRFSSQRNFRDKLEIFVEYPVEGLDITKYVQNPEEGKELVYDLIAVDNHYGGLGGGHYTANGKNFYNGEWYDYNDSHVSRRESDKVVTPHAYILFYRRRSNPPHAPLGGSKMEELYESMNNEHDSDMANSRDPSPGAGEGRRLGDSSHNGSSGPGAVGAAHQSGVGGLEMGNQNRGLQAGMTEEDETQETTITTNELEDEGLGEDVPPYGSDLVWTETPGWGFDILNATNEPGQQPNNSDNDEMFGDADAGSNSSTRVAGAGSEVADEDLPMFSDDMEQDTRMRGIRESAPPPGTEDVVVDTGVGEADDEDDELPVTELRAGDDGELAVSFARR
ncbi:uncharacterized protein HMPREF1541_05949 [Cyphellophora europaea CBS 101466]|uniref:ubiquitinyl hydrolase 1 n=1 Tax=Cyphellophora europaea (strain CBS 101466) TaxID=1220924 RepID=W2RVB5_CYPE1|nr:uncharacterized protein HMPREF1541_05949 [Cyphellophora europaea CBS 101466]ETN39723.1 hypothetical protein HMPREF1541_05949 [Cyphellophora europaea CBS 101466]